MHVVYVILHFRLVLYVNPFRALEAKISKEGR